MWDQLSGKEKKPFKLAFRARRSLAALEKIIAAKGGAPLAKAAVTVPAKQLSDAQIRERAGSEG